MFRIDVKEAMMRVRATEEIENAGGTLDERQVMVLEHALSVIAADSLGVTSLVDEQPTVFGDGTDTGTSSAKPVVRKLSEKQLFCLRRDLPIRNAHGIAITTVTELLARCEREGTDPLTVVPARLASDALSILFAAGYKTPVVTVPAATAPVATVTPAAVPVATVARTDAPVVTEAGAYRNAAGEIYRVQASRESGRLYAKRLDQTTGKFDYVKGAIYTLSADMRMTLAEAMEFGKESARAAKEAGRPHGWCVFGHKLTDPKSIAKGIGPVCEGRI
jgi:predicted RNA-binding protein with PIN domain